METTGRGLRARRAAEALFDQIQKLADADSAANAADPVGEPEFAAGALKLARNPLGRREWKAMMKERGSAYDDVIAAMIAKSVASLEHRARESSRVGEKLLHPIQTAALAGLVALLIGWLAATLEARTALIAAVPVYVLAHYASRARSSYARRESLIRQDADLIRGLL